MFVKILSLAKPLKLILILLISLVFFLLLCVFVSRSFISSEEIKIPSIFKYRVSLVSNNNTIELGIYKISFFINGLNNKAMTVVEDREYTLSHFETPINIRNIRTYMFGIYRGKYALFNFKEEEYVDDEINLTIVYAIEYGERNIKIWRHPNYDIPKDERMISTFDENTRNIPSIGLPVSIYYSEILKFVINNTKYDIGHEWYSINEDYTISLFQVIGLDGIYVDAYSEVQECYLIKEKVKNRMHVWINSISNILRVEEIMDSDYSTVYELIEVVF
jgi:hypothetical protein